MKNLVTSMCEDYYFPTISSVINANPSFMDGLALTRATPSSNVFGCPVFKIVFQTLKNLCYCQVQCLSIYPLFKGFFQTLKTKANFGF